MSVRSGPGWETPLVQFGLGAFESMRVQDGRVPLWPYHKERLMRALHTWGVKESFPADIEEELQTFLTRGELRLKLLMGIGEDDRLIWHWYAHELELLEKPLRLLLLETCANSQKFKSCNYADHFLARQRARGAGFGDALYVDENEILLECSSGAVFVMDAHNGNCAETGMLQSVVREKLLQEHPDYWQVKKSSLSELRKNDYLVYGNAVQGLVGIEKVIDSTEKCRYERKTDWSFLESWNKWLFER